MLVFLHSSVPSLTIFPLPAVISSTFEVIMSKICLPFKAQFTWCFLQETSPEALWRKHCSFLCPAVVNWNYIMLIFNSYKFKTACSARGGRAWTMLPTILVHDHGSTEAWLCCYLGHPYVLEVSCRVKGTDCWVVVWALLVQDYSSITQAMQQACSFIWCSARGTPIWLCCLAASSVLYWKFKGL